MKKMALLITFCLFLMPVAAFADTSVDFSFVTLGSQSGTWTWPGGAPGALFGNSGNLTIFAGAVNGVTLTGSELTFQTGTPSSGNDVLGATFGSAGSSIDISAGSVCTTDCFSGAFTGSQMLTTGDGLVFESNFVAGNIDATLLGLLDVPTSPTGYTGVISLNLRTGTCPTVGDSVVTAGTVCGTWNSGDLSLNTPAPVPEPGSLALFGTGLLGVAGFLRRKLMSR